MGLAWRSGRVSECGDAIPGGDDVAGPGPAGLYFQLPPAGTAGYPGGGVQERALLTELAGWVPQFT